jgi:hypothetical protein
MKTALVLVVGCLAISSTASAGGYLGLSLGTQPAANDDFESRIGQPTGRSLRGLAGLRFGNVSLEGAINGFDVLTARYGEHTAFQASASLKLNLPIGNDFEVFGRVGAERTWLKLNDNGFDFTGDGFVAGGGIEYRLNAVLANASIFLDYNVHHSTLESVRFDVGDTFRVWSLGFTVGL